MMIVANQRMEHYGAFRAEVHAPRSPDKMKILILEDNEERIAAFQAACAALSAEAKVWRNAHRMVGEIGQHLATADVISLDHDLNDDAGDDAGCGMDVARELARLKPTCPIVLHTSNTSAGWSMVNELRTAGWDVSRVPPVTMGTSWIAEDWLPAVQRIMKMNEANNTPEPIGAKRASGSA